MKMHEIRSFKIFICLILTAVAAVLWLSVWSHFASDVGQTTYEDAVFVEIEDNAPKKGEDILWSI